MASGQCLMAEVDGTIQNPTVSKSSMARRLAVASAVTVVLAVSSFTLYGYWISERARFMLRTAQELSEQETQPTVDQIRQRFGARLQAEYCGADICSYNVTVSNRVFAALHVVPYTELRSNFWVRNGLVYENLLDYMTHGRRSQECNRARGHSV